jgi:hypothetical protein
LQAEGWMDWAKLIKDKKQAATVSRMRCIADDLMVAPKVVPLYACFYPTGGG